MPPLFSGWDITTATPIGLCYTHKANTKTQRFLKPRQRAGHTRNIYNTVPAPASHTKMTEVRHLLRNSHTGGRIWSQGSVLATNLTTCDEPSTHNMHGIGYIAQKEEQANKRAPLYKTHGEKRCNIPTRYSGFQYAVKIELLESGLWNCRLATINNSLHTPHISRTWLKRHICIRTTTHTAVIANKHLRSPHKREALIQIPEIDNANNITGRQPARLRKARNICFRYTKPHFISPHAGIATVGEISRIGKRTGTNRIKCAASNTKKRTRDKMNHINSDVSHQDLLTEPVRSTNPRNGHGNVDYIRPTKNSRSLTRKRFTSQGHMSARCAIHLRDSKPTVKRFAHAHTSPEHVLSKHTASVINAGSLKTILQLVITITSIRTDVNASIYAHTAQRGKNLRKYLIKFDLHHTRGNQTNVDGMKRRQCRGKQKLCGCGLLKPKQNYRAKSGSQTKSATAMRSHDMTQNSPAGTWPGHTAQFPTAAPTSTLLYPFLPTRVQTTWIASRRFFTW